MAFICYLTQSQTWLKFYSLKPEHMSFKRIFFANLSSLVFIHLISYLKNHLFQLRTNF